MSAEAGGGLGLWQQAWRRLRRDRAAVAAAVILLLIVILCVAGPWLSPFAFDQIDFDSDWAQPPGAGNGHWFGTDALGRDLFVRALAGGRLSLAVGLASTLVSVLIGVTWGAVAGYFGGRLDQFLMRTVDVL